MEDILQMIFSVAEVAVAVLMIFLNLFSVAEVADLLNSDNVVLIFYTKLLLH